MTFRFYHSLALRAAFSVVLSLWYHEDIDSLKSFVSTSFYNNSPICVDSAMRNGRLALRKRVTNSVSELLIPESVKRYLLEFVQIVGENLEDWIVDQYRETRSLAVKFVNRERGFWQERIEIVSTRGYPDHVPVYGKLRVDAAIDVDLRNVLRWNPDGEIDLEQTGEALVQNESDTVKRFRLACDYCREDEMLRLWPTIRGELSTPEAWVSNWAYSASALFWWRYFRYFWPQSTFAYLFHLEATESVPGTSAFTAKLLSSCFDTKIHYRCPLATYLSNKINTVHAGNIIPGEEDISSIRFAVILSRMPESCHGQILRDFPKAFLKHLLLWRHHSFFEDTVERNWDIFDEDLFDSIFFHIVDVIVRYEDSDIYKRIFQRFWAESPARLRDVERILYDRNLHRDPSYPPQVVTLRDFVGIHFSRSSSAEDAMKRLLFEGRHVLDLVTRVRLRDVLSDLVLKCLPSEEWDEKLKILNFFCRISCL